MPEMERINNEECGKGIKDAISLVPIRFYVCFKFLCCVIVAVKVNGHSMHSSA
jgi:hypothetical protein